MENLISNHPMLFCFMFIFAVATFATVFIVAIVKKRRFKASGWCDYFGFDIEADDDNDEEETGRTT